MKTPPLSSCLDPGPILLHAGQQTAKGTLPSVAAFTAAKNSGEQAISAHAASVAGFPFGKTRLKTYLDKLQLQKMLVEARLEHAEQSEDAERNPLLPVMTSINIDGSIFGGRRSAPPAITSKPSSSRPSQKPRPSMSPEPLPRSLSPPGRPASCGHSGGSWMGAFDTAATDQLRKQLASQGSHMESVQEDFEEKRDVPGEFSGRTAEGESLGQEEYSEALEELEDLRHEIQHMENTLQILKPSGTDDESKSLLPRNPSRASKVSSPTWDLSGPPPSTAFDAKLRQWEQQAFGPVVPVTRREALALEATLDEIPQTAKFGQEVAFGQTEAYEILDTAVVDREFELVDMIFKEIARQVQASCVEQGHVLDKLRRRYGAFLHGLRLFCVRAQDASVRALTRMVRAREAERAAQSRAERLEQALARAQVDAKALQDRTNELQMELLTVQKDAEAQLIAMQASLLGLQHERKQLSEKVQSAETDKDTAVVTHVAYMQEDLCALIDERNELQEKVERLTGQLVRSKWGGLLQPNAHMGVATENQSVQTEDGSFHLEDSGSSDDDEERKRIPNADAFVPSEAGRLKRLRKRRAKNEAKNKYGCFSALLDTDRIGRVKPKGWLLKVIAQLYLEKIASDAFDAQRGETKTPELHEFVYDWHLHRYGLRPLAEANILDLIASVRRYQADNLKARMFGQFCGLVGAERRPPEAFQFYLHCMQVMAPSGILALFPETDEGTCWLKPLKALEAVRTIFTNAADALQLRQFIVSRIEPLIDPKTKMYDADAVLMALLDEWQRRYERNEAHLRALFRAGDANHDGVMTFDEWKEVIKHANEQMNEREITQMFREALLSSADGESIDQTSFVAIARKHRLWKWTFHPDAEAPLSSEAKSPSENLFCMLDEALSGADDPGNQLARFAEKSAERGGDKAKATVESLEAKLAAFMKVYQERKDAEAAWAGYRQLVGDLQHAVRRFNQPFKHAVRAILNIREFLKSASPSPGVSPVGSNPRSPFNRPAKKGPSRLQEKGKVAGEPSTDSLQRRGSSTVRKAGPTAAGPAALTAASAWRPGGSRSKPGPKPFSGLSEGAPSRPGSRNENRPPSHERPKTPVDTAPHVIPSANFVAVLATEESQQAPVGSVRRPGSPTFRVGASPESIVGVFGARLSSRPSSPSLDKILGRPDSAMKIRPRSPGISSRPSSREIREDIISRFMDEASLRRGDATKPRPLSGRQRETPIWPTSTPLERKKSDEKRGLHEERRSSDPKESAQMNDSGQSKRSSSDAARSRRSTLSEEGRSSGSSSRRSSELSRRVSKDALSAATKTAESTAESLESIHASLCDRLSMLQVPKEEDSDIKAAPSFEAALKTLERKLSDSGGRFSDGSAKSSESTMRLLDSSDSGGNLAAESSTGGPEKVRAGSRPGTLKKGREEVSEAQRPESRGHNTVRFVDALD